MEMPSFRLIWLIVALMNCVIYAVVGAVYVRLRKWRSGAATT
jgi:hypothetical protein